MIYTLKELAAHHDATGSVVSRYVPESDYKKLQQERDALAAQVDSLLDNCKAFVKKEFELLKEVERLEIELKKRDEQNAALAATVEALHSAIDGIRASSKSSGFGFQSPQSARDSRIAWMKLNELLVATPQQHLAELRAEAVASVNLDAYDAGYLNDFGGGNVSWWQDYIRSELGVAHDFYQHQIDNYAESLKGGKL